MGTGTEGPFKTHTQREFIVGDMASFFAMTSFRNPQPSGTHTLTAVCTLNSLRHEPGGAMTACSMSRYPVDSSPTKAGDQASEEARKHSDGDEAKQRARNLGRKLL